MIRARGNTACINPAKRKLAGILSTTRSVPAGACAVRARYCSAMDEIALAPAAPTQPYASYAAKASSQKDISPAPNTAGCEARICSASEVPDRGMPSTNTGRSEADADPDADPGAEADPDAPGGALMNRASNVAINLSMRRASFCPSYTAP